MMNIILKGKQLFYRINKPAVTQTAGFLYGSGRRIRTLTNRVRVCRATVTQSR